MNILGLPPECSGGADKVHITVHPPDWRHFDKTVCWLVDNGVPLQVRGADHWTRHHIVNRRGRPYANGTLVLRKMGTQPYEGYVDGEELSARYVVYMPEELR